MATVCPVIKVTADGETQVNSFVKVTSGEEYAWEIPLPGSSVADTGWVHPGSRIRIRNTELTKN
jgi:hypothetical protein